MKWFFNRCRRQRQKLCLFASGALSEEEAVGIQNHLAACSECRNYHAGIKITATPLAGWEKHFEHIEPRPAVQVRWANAIRLAERDKSIALFSPGTVLRECWRQLIWPSRRIWAGLAAVWLLILIANLNFSAGAPRMTAKTSSHSADFILAFREQADVLAELTGCAEPKIAEPSKPFVPRPRSERRQEVFTI